MDLLDTGLVVVGVVVAVEQVVVWVVVVDSSIDYSIGLVFLDCPKRCMDLVDMGFVAVLVVVWVVELVLVLVVLVAVLGFDNLVPGIVVCKHNSIDFELARGYLRFDMDLVDMDFV
jgi:hypothetical protein